VTSGSTYCTQTGQRPMGKRKQKVRWCIVDGLDWNNGNEEEGSGTEGTAGPGMAATVKAGEANTKEGRRSSGGREGWGGSVAPRFERKAAATAEQKHIYYEGEYCEAEELPNGFTKIRSKNLDILFKRDYYEQRLAIQRLASEQADKEAQGQTQGEEVVEAEEQVDETGSREGEEGGREMAATAVPPGQILRQAKSFDQMDPSEIPEFKPTGSKAADIEGETSGHTSPFYGNYSAYPAGYNPEFNYTQAQQTQQAPPRPNLYLYSPSNNTLIPCEEIIIPNPVMSPEGPVYSGPTNIYLAYPVQGPDGRGYITQPFSGPSYSPGSGSCDSTNCYSSTPHTPNSGQDSGSSTQPTSPPPLVNYHPSNWVRPTPVAANGQPLAQEEKRSNSPLAHVPAFVPRNMPARHQQHQQEGQDNGRGGPLSHHDGPRTYQQQHQQAQYQQHHQQRGPRSPRAAEQQQLQQLQQQNGFKGPELPNTAPTVTYIPGLPAESASPKKTAKRRKKKKNEPASNMNRENGHRGSTSSESEVRASEETIQIHLTNGEVQQLQLTPSEVDLELERKQDEVQELHLTDDLADSLMNPPTEPEQSDEEPVQMEMKNETEEVLLEDQEVQGITEAVEEAKNKDMCSLAEEVQLVREPSPQVVRSQIEKKDAPSSMPETLVLEEEDCEKTETAAADVVEKVSAMEVDTVKKESAVEEVVKEEVAQTTAGDNEVGGEAPKEKQQGSRGQRNNRQQGGKRSWEKEKKKEKKATQEEKRAVADKPQEVSKTTAPPTELPKKSYSSAMKSNLVEKPATVAAAPKSNSLSSQKEDRPAQRVPAVKETPAVRESDEVWETIPPSVASGEPESWERTPQSKKRKHKKSAREAVVRFEAKEEEEEIHSAPALVKEAKPVAANNEVIKEAVPVVQEAKEEMVKEEVEMEGEQEEKRRKETGRRRRKKHGSEDPEEGAGGHRVVICDDQVEIQFMRSGQRPADLLLAPPMDKVKAGSGNFADFLIVSELGCGIQRGCMGLGRLYQGKYVPPERTDGLLPEEKRILKEEKEVEDKEDKEEQEKEEVETSAPPAADIDLD